MRKRPQHPGSIAGYWLGKRDGSECWHRCWYEERTRQTRRVSLGTTDFDEAEVELARWVTNNADMRQQRPEQVTVARVLSRHYEHHGRHLRSAEAVRFSLLRWNEFFKGALVSEVTAPRIREFVETMRGENLSDGYIRRVLADGKSALNRAYREGEIASVPYVKLVSESEPRDRVATIDEIAALFRAAQHDHERMYLLLAICTAARPEAILQLTTFQIDLDKRLIKLNPQGRKQTKKRRPTLPICGTLLSYLKDAPVGHLVKWAGKPLKGFRTTFNRMKVRTNVPSTADLTCYSLRHTMAAEMRRRGVPNWEVAGWLGHSSGYKSTEVYAKFGPDHLSGATRAIDAYCADLRTILAETPLGPVFNRVRASGVSLGQAPMVQPIGMLVEPSGIEPLTSTMPL
jgi:integrase